MKKQGKRSWFDIATTVWAIALVVTALMWVATPAFAGGGGGVDCYGACVWLEKCAGDAGGCFTAHASQGDCWGECGDGSFWECGYGMAQ